MFVQYFLNIDMASQQIPYEDELTPRGDDNTHSAAENTNKDGGLSTDDGDQDGENQQTTPQPSTAEESSDEFTKMQRNVAIMQEKLKRLGKQKKRKRRPPVEGAPGPSSATAEAIENVENVIEKIWLENYDNDDFFGPRGHDLEEYDDGHDDDHDEDEEDEQR